MAESKQLILVDGSSYLFRAFHALPPLVTSRGQPTGAVKGVINMIRSLIKSYADANIAIVFDAKGKTFRNEIYPEYKAHRPPMPDDLRSQIKPIHQIIAAMGLPLLIIEGVEADDVIGTLSRHASNDQVDTLISTGDKDLAQLVNGHVTLMNTMTNEFLDGDGVKNKFGVAPNRIIDYLALVGDKSDNIPGVPSVGPKTAVKWLQEYDSMEGIIENADAIGGKVGEKLRDNIDLLRLSYELATIKLDLELDIKIPQLVHGDEDLQALHDLFSEMEFKSWIKELEDKGVSGGSKKTEQGEAGGNGKSDADEDYKPISVAPEDIEYTTVLSEEEFEELLDRTRGSELFSLSIESTGEHFLEATILGLAFSFEFGKGFYIPLAHDYEDAPQQLDCAEVLGRLKAVLENPAIIKAGYDLKHCRHVLKNYDIDLQPLKTDVLLASYVVNSVASKHKLADIAAIYLQVEAKPLEDLLGKGRGKLSENEVAIDDYAPYAAERADLILRLASTLEHELTIHGHLLGLYQYYEIPLIQVLGNMERNGILVDAVLLAKQSKELGTQLAKLQLAVFEIAGYNI